MKKKTDDIIENKEEVIKENILPYKVKVIFKNEYMGKLGNYYKGNIYELPIELYGILKIDCEEIK